MTLPEATRWPERCAGCGYHEATQGCACKGTLLFFPAESRGREEVRAMTSAGNAAAVLSRDAAVMSPLAGKSYGIARAEAAADPSDRARIDAAIRTVAARGAAFSANDVRPLIPNAHGPLVGARFNAAARSGLIYRVGYESSTKANTHAHPIATWRAVA